MNDQRPGWYYRPNEGMRYWDGQGWSEGEPRSQDTEAAVAAETSTTSRPPGGGRVLPWLVAGIAVVAAGVMATLMLIGGGAGGEVAQRSVAADTPVSATATATPTPTLTPAAARTRTPTPAADAPAPTKRPSTPTATAPKKATRTVSSQPAPSSAPKPVDSFDDAYAHVIAGRILRDIASADERMLDSPEIRGDSAMAFLSQDMSNLEKAGIPDVEDRAHYIALVRTLGEFYDKAEWQLAQDQINEAAATYTVAREATSDLLAILNPILGTQHRLPEWSWL